MKKQSKTIWESLSEALIYTIKLPQVRDWLIGKLMSLLKMQAIGGLRGWLLRKVVTEFQDEVIEAIELATDFKVRKDVLDGTIDMEDRDAATDVLNDIW